MRVEKVIPVLISHKDFKFSKKHCYMMTACCMFLLTWFWTHWPTILCNTTYWLPVKTEQLLGFAVPKNQAYWQYDFARFSSVTCVKSVMGNMAQKDQQWSRVNFLWSTERFWNQQHLKIMPFVDSRIHCLHLIFISFQLEVVRINFWKFDPQPEKDCSLLR